MMIQQREILGWTISAFVAVSLPCSTAAWGSTSGNWGNTWEDEQPAAVASWDRWNGGGVRSSTSSSSRTSTPWQRAPTANTQSWSNPTISWSSTTQAGNTWPSTTTSSQGLDRIIGGSPVATGAYPYFALLKISDNSFCGGSLVAKDVVLTAAHCLQGGVDGRTVFVGGRNPSRNDAESFKVVDYKRHPDFLDRSGALYNDFMLVKLDRASSQPIVSVNTQDSRPSANSMVTVIGFGHTEQGGSNSDVLRETNVNVVDSDTCDSNYAGNIRSEIHLCAASSGRDSCQNDSGGPLIQGGSVVGVVSFGSGCAQSGFPGVYARTSGAENFIKRSICDLSDSPPGDCGDSSDSGFPILSDIIPDDLLCPNIDFGLFNFARDIYRETLCCPDLSARFFSNPLC